MAIDFLSDEATHELRSNLVGIELLKLGLVVRAFVIFDELHLLQVYFFLSCLSRPISFTDAAFLTLRVVVFRMGRGKQLRVFSLLNEEGF